MKSHVRVAARFAGLTIFLAVPTVPLTEASAALAPQAVPDRLATPPAGGQAPAARSGIESYPDDPRLDTAVKMLARGGYDIAEMTARTVMKSKGNVERANAILGVALLKQRKYEEAKPFLIRARDSQQPFPERKHAPHFLGWACYHLGELTGAKEAFEAHLALVPNEPDSTFGLGLVALAEDRLDDADALFDAALKGFVGRNGAKSSDEAKVLVRQSDVAVRRGELEKAQELLLRAVRLNTVQYESWAKLARVAERLGKTYDAEVARAQADRILKARGARPVDEESTSFPTAPVGGAAAPSANPAPQASPADAPEAPKEAPAEAKPAESKPAEPKLSEPKPGESKP